MGDSWHSSSRAPAARRLGDFGFYDSAYQIAVLPQQEVEPSVIVDHELSHVNLVLNSSIGALERMLVWVEWTAHSNGNAEAVTRSRALTELILSATAAVHEAAAWFGTELQSEGHEDVKAPAAYATDVRRIRHVFDRMPAKPFATLSENLSHVLAIADSIAIYALSPPFMRTLWLRPEILSVDFLREALKRDEENPLRRFRAICSQMRGVPFPDALTWARAVGVEGRGVPSDAHKQRRSIPTGRSTGSWFQRRRDIPASFRSELFELGTARVLHGVATKTGLFGSPTAMFTAGGQAAGLRDENVVEEAFASFEVTHNFIPEIDRYSQVCVLETPKHWRALLYDDRPELAALVLASMPYVIVRVAPPISATAFARAPKQIQQVIITGPYEGEDADGAPLRPTWNADTKGAASFLRSCSRRTPIIATSVGYDFGAGDYAGASVLHDVPHVVVAIRDLRSLWLAFGMSGLCGCQTIGWMPMPSPSGRRHFGFLLFRPADREYPIVVNPTLISHYERAITVAETWPSSCGVRLVKHRGNPYEWMGPMTHAVMSAAAVFEMGGRADAVSMAAQVYRASQSARNGEISDGRDTESNQ